MKQLVILLLAITPLFLFSQGSAKNTINWISLKEAKALAEKHNQKMLIFFYKKDCPYCEKMKKETIKNGVYNLKHGGFEYPITYQLIKDGRKNLVLNKKINAKIPVTLFHGSKDEAVPVIFSKKLIKIFNNANKKLNIIKNGDHSLFAKKYQLKIIRELKSIISQY